LGNLNNLSGLGLSNIGNGLGSNLLGSNFWFI
jgi:hypothetical protein